MLKENPTIEDCLELLAGLKTGPKMEIISSDYTILSSIARQVFKGIGLTDKQYELCKTKLINSYTDHFLKMNIDITDAVEKTRLPLRVIDRRKFIRLVTIEDRIILDNQVVSDYSKNLQWFCVRFPFSKKIISDIEHCVSDRKTYYHGKGTHVHFFVANEKNVYNVINTFKEKDFIIDEQLLDFYNNIVEIKNNPNNYIPTIDSYQLFNVSKKLQLIAEEEIGPLSEKTLIFYIDRKRRYGIDRIKDVVIGDGLSFQIATRKDVDFLSKPSESELKQLLESIHQLNRYPLLVIVDDKHAEQQVYDTFNIFRHLIAAKEQSVLFRLNNDVGASFNEYVKDKSLNNWVDRNTKIVYISNEKLPKLLVSGEWKPSTALVFGSFPNRYSDAYVSSYCDLIIYRDETMSPFKKILR